MTDPLSRSEIPSEVAEVRDDAAMTINQDGSPVKIEAVYYQYFVVYRREFDSIEEALGFIEYGEDDGRLSSVGVYVDGEPRVWDGFVTKDAPTPEQAQTMRDEYAKAEETW